VKSWAAFEDKVGEIRDKYGTCENPARLGHQMNNAIFFRGQADYDWHLEITLERYSGSPEHTIGDVGENTT
jgi:hypothetical protein